MGDWSFGEETQTATRLAKAFAPWMRDAGMATVGRHVPDGAVAADSHLELPVDPRPLTDIEARDLAPLSELIDEDIASRIELLPVAKAGGRF
jgi:beta-N-acetylhexosaminidase